MTQQDPDHGEAWNNIAAIWVQLDRNKEAFSALGECVKHKRENWQVKRGESVGKRGRAGRCVSCRGEKRGRHGQVGRDAGGSTDAEPGTLARPPYDCPRSCPLIRH